MQGNYKDFFKETVPLSKKILQLHIDPVALAIYCSLASRDTGWQFDSKELKKQFKIKQVTLRRKFEILEKLNLINIVVNHDEQGKLLNFELKINHDVDLL